MRSIGITKNIAPLQKTYSGKTITAIQENTTMPGAGELNLLNATGVGCVKSIGLITGGSTNYSARLSRIVCTVDGVQRFNVPIVDFFFSRGFGSDGGSGTQWRGNRIGMSKHYDNGEGDIRCGWYRYIDIPYTESCEIKLVNGDGGDDLAVWSAISYKTGYGVYPNPQTDFMGTYHAAYLGTEPGYVGGRVTTPYEAVTLVEDEGEGLLESIWLTIYQAPGENWVEGNMEVYIDGETTPSFYSSGTEDFFMSAFAWSGIYHTTNHGLVVREANGFTNMYRFVLPEEIYFEDSIKVLWHAGDVTQGVVENNLEMWSLVGYYLK